MTKISISVVSPVYGAENLLDQLHSRLTESLKVITPDYEIILVNDSSPDNSWSKIQEICKRDSKVKGINLSRNFGQHYAISAGLKHTTKEWTVVMDCDLQDQPEQIMRFIPHTKEFDVIVARRSVRQDNLLRKIFSKSFYSVLGYLTGSKQDSTIANFGLYSSKVINAINNSGEQIRYFPTMVQWVGFRSVKVDVDHASRPEGESSYNFKKMMKLALDIILAYSDKPLRLVVKLGLAISSLSFLFVGYVVLNALLGKYQVLGYASIMASLWFLSGIIILTLGIIGLYLGKTFEQSKGRATFIVKDLINFKDI